MLRLDVDESVVWILRDDPSRHSCALTECRLMQNANGLWDMEIRRGAETLITEPCVSRTAARMRAFELQRVLLSHGWTTQTAA